MAIRIKCKCGTILKITLDMAGKRSSCPTCKNAFMISEEKYRAAEARAAATAPAKQRPTAPQEIPLPTETGATPSELDLAAAMPGSSSGVMDVSAQGGKTCTNCHGAMDAGARICVICGFDTVTGEVHATAKSSAKTKREDGETTKLRRTIVTRFLLGVGLSVSGALVGGVVWFIVAYKMDLELGYVAWGIGLLSGMGMAFGAGDGSTKAGLIAAANAGLAIVAAKFAIFVVLIVAFATGAGASVEANRQFVIYRETEKALDKAGVKDETERENRWDEVSKPIEARVKQMPDSKVNELADKYRAELDSGKEQATSVPTKGAPRPKADSDAEDSNESSGDASPSNTDDVKLGKILVLFFKSFFGVFDILWGFLALGTAYRIGFKGREAFQRD